MNREKGFTGGIEGEQLQSTFTLMESKFFEWRKESTEKTIKEFQQAMMYFDDYSRFVASNHWDNERGDFYVFNENYHNFDEWRKENVEEILDKSIESLQTNGGMSEASMEAEYEKIARWDYDHDDGDQSWPQFTEAYYDKNEKLIILKIYEGYNDTWTSKKITIEEFLQEYKRAEENNWITKKINEDFFSSLSKENQRLDADKPEPKDIKEFLEQEAERATKELREKIIHDIEVGNSMRQNWPYKKIAQEILNEMYNENKPSSLHDKELREYIDRKFKFNKSHKIDIENNIPDENRQNEIAQSQEEFEKEENSVSKENQLLVKTNNSLEQSSLDKASELLKGIQFTPENYKKLLNVINDITEMSGNEQLKVPTEEQVQKAAQEKDQQPQTEIRDVENEQKQNIDTFDPNAPVIYGKTILPAFTVMAEGKLHSIENAVVMKFNKANQTYLIDNGNEKLELPSKTFETLLKDKQEQEEKIKRAEGRTIVFQDKERGIDGTVIPEFSMYTQHGLETFKDFVPIKHNPADDSYVISNGDSTMTVTAERFKEITAPERFENKFDENSPAWKKLCEQEYKDFFEPRDNCAYNFRHNLSVYCRKEANSPCDALHLAKDIISRMSKTEQKNTEKLLKSLQNENETMNELIARIYHEAIQEQPLNEEYIKKYQPENVIARPMYDTISANGTKIENDPALIKGSVNRNLEIGSTLKNVSIETGSIFGKGKDTMHFDELKVISASKEGNTITVMDSNKSFFKLPRDTVLEMYKDQQLKEIKHGQRQTRSNTMSISYS